MPGCRKSQSHSKLRHRGQAPVETRQRQADAVERAAAQVYRNSPPLSPASFDVAVAEITARQSRARRLYAAGRCRRAPRRRSRGSSFRAPDAPPAPAYASAAPPQPGPDFSRSSAIPAQDHQPDRIAPAPWTIPSRRSTPFRSELAGDPQRHHRGDAAPRDRIDRERDPLAASAHRRDPLQPAPTVRSCPASSTRCPTSSRCCAR